jgi:hypothetical protein
MRIEQDVEKARVTARRLAALSNLGAAGTRPLSLARAHEAVATMHGYRDWNDLSASADDPALPDHAVTARERRLRRAQQAAVLVGLGYSGAGAAAMVEVTLPSGDAESELAAAGIFANGYVAGTDGRDGRSLNAAWLLERLGLPPEREGWARSVAAVREQLDGGLAAAFQKMRDGFAQRTQDSEQGYFVVIAEARDFYQGYMLVDPGADIVGRCSDIIDAAMSSSGSVDAFLEGLNVIIGSGFTVMPFGRSGPIQAALVTSAMRSPNDPASIAGFSTLLARETGFRRFAVRLVEDAGQGMTTSVEAIPARTIGEVRAWVAALPETRRIRARLSRKLGLPKDFGG